MYQFPKFTKNKVKQAFLNAGGWRIIEESDETLKLMPNGHKAKECFKFLDLSYNSVIEGRAWWVSEPVQDDVKQYLESQRIRSDYSSQISELESKKDKEESRFSEYDRKYRDNFVRVRTAKSDF